MLFDVVRIHRKLRTGTQHVLLFQKIIFTKNYSFLLVIFWGVTQNVFGRKTKMNENFLGFSIVSTSIRQFLSNTKLEHDGNHNTFL
jgi:hypothetical protein